MEVSMNLRNIPTYLPTPFYVGTKSYKSTLLNNFYPRAYQIKLILTDNEGQGPEEFLLLSLYFPTYYFSPRLHKIKIVFLLIENDR